MKNSIQIREVGLRDGLQLSKTKLSSEIKIKWCSLQSKAGFKEIEVASFVPPSILPQFSDASKMVCETNKINNLIPSVLVPNLKGALIALDNNSKKINFVLSASEMHNRSNVNSTIKKSLSMFKDTVGYANPNQVKEIFKSLNKISKNIPLAAHFHDTRGMGLANVISAIDEGVKRFDASLGGLGGCPYAPGASGNIATEDCVYMIESMGFSTGIDLKKLLKLRKSLKEWMKNDILYGNLLTSGFAKTFNI